MADGFAWDGISAIMDGIKRAKEARDKGARRGLLLGARIVLNASNQRVPWENGDLSRDGGISMDEDRLLVAVSYGRSAETKDYAVPQHERMDYNHDAGKSAKFLELALNGTRDTVAAVIAQQIKGEIDT